MPIAPNPSNLSELTVTCHQCGSPNMERLDRKEYRCKNCGAITVISDNDADRVEDLLRQALNRPGPTATPRLSPKAIVAPLAGIAIFLMVLAIGIPALFSFLTNPTNSSGGIRIRRDDTVPVEDVTISQLVWSKTEKRYEGTVYNHSGYAIDVPRYTMTLFTEGHRSGSTWSDTPISRLLPGEYEPISFDPRSLSSDAQPDRYELDKPDRIDRNTDEIARLDVSQQQLVHQEGKDFYKFIGVVHNTLTRPIDGARVLIVLYDPNHQVLAFSNAYIEALRPGENGLIDQDLYTDANNMPVAAYEYLVDAAYTGRTR